MRVLTILSEKLNKITEKVVAVLLAAMAIVVFLQVIFRYVFHASLPWSEELSRYILVWLTFLSASIAVRRNAHIGVEAVVNFLPLKAKKAVKSIAYLLTFILFIILIYYGGKVVQITMHQMSPAMRIPMGYMYAAVLVGACLMTLHLFVRIFVLDREVQ